MRFANEAHKNRFRQLIDKDKTQPGDVERAAFFYLVAYDYKLFEMVEEFYNFSTHRTKALSFCISWDKRIECKAIYTQAQKELIKLAYSLLGDRLIPTIGLTQIFKTWNDMDNAVILTALSTRYNMAYELSLVVSMGDDEYYGQYIS